MRYFAEIAFVGTAYHGWQKQENAHAVQSAVDSAISTYLQENIQVMGCGRTDTGVHATQFFIHFDTKKELDSDRFPFKVNAILPADIAVKRVFQVEEDAHCRFHGIQRSYEYHVHFQKNPFLAERSYRVRTFINAELMNQAAEQLLGEKEFGAFCKSGGGNQTNICKVTRAEWVENEGQMIFHISANRFLRNMVRAVVGTLFEVGMGKMTIDEFIEVLNSQDRRKAGFSVPAHGLYLTEVKYAKYE